MPRASAAIDTRPPSSTCNVFTKPFPSAPRRFDEGTKQSLKTTSEVSLALMPSLFSFLPGRKPAFPFSRMKAEIPFDPLALSVTAMATHTSAEWPFLVNVFAPLRIQPPSFRVATHLVPPASHPASSSVSHQQPRFFPFASGVTYFLRCSSLPNL